GGGRRPSALVRPSGGQPRVGGGGTGPAGAAGRAGQDVQRGGSVGAEHCRRLLSVPGQSAARFSEGPEHTPGSPYTGVPRPALAGARRPAATGRCSDPPTQNRARTMKALSPHQTDKHASWAFAESRPDEDEVMLRARERSADLGITPVSEGTAALLT